MNKWRCVVTPNDGCVNGTFGENQVILCLLGDANGDRAVNIGDVTAIERIILRLSTLTIGADSNGDGNVDMGDAVTIEKIILGLD